MEAEPIYPVLLSASIYGIITLLLIWQANRLAKSYLTRARQILGNGIDKLAVWVFCIVTGFNEEPNVSRLLQLFNVLFVIVGVCRVLDFIKAVFSLLRLEWKKVDLDRYGRRSWAVVTGSTEGIGKAFAEELGKRGFNVYQISRNPVKLKTLETELTTKYFIQVKSRTWDFGQCGHSLDEFIEAVEVDLAGKDVAFLVNNVGTTSPGMFYDIPQAAVNQVLTVNCLPIIYLCRLLIPAMQKRALPCAVINLSSLVGLHPIAGTSLYSATKKFDDYFTALLATKPGNVTFMSLRPGYTETLMTADIPQRHLLISASQCARAALRDLGGDLTFTGHIKHKLIMSIMSKLPEGFVAWLSLKEIVKRLRKGEASYASEWLSL